MKRLIRKAEDLDIYNRDAAIAYINGNVYMAETHAMCVGMYLDDINSSKDLDDYKNRPTEEELNEVDVNRVGFAHLLEKAKAIDYAGLIVLQPGIYIESNTVVNVTISEVSSAIKQIYPQYDVFEVDGNINSHEDVEKIAMTLKLINN
jgi:hypothetical protein